MRVGLERKGIGCLMDWTDVYASVPSFTYADSDLTLPNEVKPDFTSLNDADITRILRGRDPSNVSQQAWSFKLVAVCDNLDAVRFYRPVSFPA
jgi:hypothetical protein